MQEALRGKNVIARWQNVFDLNRPCRELSHSLRIATVACAMVVTAGACVGEEDGKQRKGNAAADGPLVVYNAGSLARPLRAALDTFAARERVRIEQESAGSLESARKLTALRQTPDLIALADHEVFPHLLMPEHVTWYAQFARNRMVLAFTDQSHYASEISGDNWLDVIRRDGVEVGRADPTSIPTATGRCGPSNSPSDTTAVPGLRRH